MNCVLCRCVEVLVCNFKLCCELCCSYVSEILDPTPFGLWGQLSMLQPFKVGGVQPCQHTLPTDGPPDDGEAAWWGVPEAPPRTPAILQCLHNTSPPLGRLPGPAATAAGDVRALYRALHAPALPALTALALHTRPSTSPPPLVTHMHLGVGGTYR